MTSVEIRGIKVTFPYEPYAIQKDYMSKVIESLQNSSNAILESPTGTGKTLSLLCSSLAWLMTEKMNTAAAYPSGDNYGGGGSVDDILKNVMSMRPPKIIYSSRTHSQLAQAMQELKNTIYKDFIKSSIVGSRDQLCLKKEVLEERSVPLQVNICRGLIKSRGCSYYHGVEKSLDPIVSKMNILDIEELVGLGKKHHFCPYYMARELKQNADLTFMPYNYLLDPNARKTFGVDLGNTVVILDEAHNIETTCEESASMTITSTDIAMAIDELTVIMKAMENEHFMLEGDAQKDFTLDDLVVIKSLLLEFEKVVTEIQIKSSDGDTYDGQYLHRLIEKAGIEFSNCQYVVNVLDKLVQYMTTTRNEAFNRNGQHLQKLKDLLVVIYENNTEELKEKVKKCFRVFIQEEVLNKGKNNSSWIKKNKNKVQKVINYWCFTPSFGMDSLMKHGVRNIILTSGTLSPLKPLISELGLDVPIRLENPHIISNNQILVKIVSNGYRNIQLDSSYKNRENHAYVDALGRTIKSFVNMIPDGLLVFFPSYTILNSCSEFWQNSGIWNEICKVKPIFTEPRSKDDFNNVICEYYAKIKEEGSKGACFFAVCRGKVSEGLDFADENGRGVIITGLPFPPLRDPRVILKKQYLDRHATRENQMANGQKWYTLEAIRAVNQAIGRVIRHKNDYGAILLCDYRFDNPNLKNDLSAWLRGYIQKTNTFAQAIAGVTKFFYEANIKFPSNSKKLCDNMVESESDNSMKYTANETAFGSVSSVEPKRILKPSVISDTSILEDYKENTNIDLPKKKNTFSVLDMDKTTSSSINFRLQDYRQPESKTFEFKQDKKVLDSNKSPEMNPQKKRKITIVPNKMDYERSNSSSNDLSTTSTSNKKAVNIVQKIAKNMTPDKIQLFHSTILKYKQDSEIFNLIKGIHDTLSNVTESEEYLNDIITFVKQKDRHVFQSYITLRSKWDLLSPEEQNNTSYSNYLLTFNKI